MEVKSWTPREAPNNFGENTDLLIEAFFQSPSEADLNLSELHNYVYPRSIKKQEVPVFLMNSN